ncbi:hypothetical protein [Haladaptatus sp. DFWS20]|uniref:hypothetical protein n=1 Tax=Haladaptatus sp. DFWS20 TaxID=3403467 RepID=UPI003EBA3D29
MIFYILFRPDDFFRERPPRPSLAGAFTIVLVLVLSLLTTVAMGVVGWQISQGTMGTDVENPNRPPD